jgi:ribose-phosphate pyrophosphokinase
VWPSGKAAVFGIAMRWFESSHPNFFFFFTRYFIMSNSNGFILFSGSSHQSLSNQIAECLGVKLGKLSLGTFPDHEIFAQVNENVRGRDVFIIQSIAERPNIYLMELLIAIDALKRASASSITVVIPYFGYARQDRKDRPRVPITARLVANLLETAGASRVITLDLHTDQLQGFFDIPLDNLYARPILLRALKELKMENVVVVAPDLGSIKMARGYSGGLSAELAIVDKRRIDAYRVEGSVVIGDVKGKTVVLVDDICSTGGTLFNAAKTCLEFGAKEIYVAITHALCGEEIFDKLDEDVIKKFFVSDSIPGAEKLQHSKIEVITSADLFARAIECINSASSISSLFAKDDNYKPMR